MLFDKYKNNNKPQEEKEKEIIKKIV